MPALLSFKFINLLFQFKNILWIPTHCGIQGNEIADALAKKVKNKNLSNISLDWTEYIKLLKKIHLINRPLNGIDYTR